MWRILLPLDVPTLTTSRLPKRSWQSEVELCRNLILDVPTFTTSRLPRVPSSQRWNYVGEKWPMNFAWNARLPRSIQESFTCCKSTTWDRRLYFPSEGKRAEDFFARKIRRLRPGLNPRTWVPKASTLPLDHRSRFMKHLPTKAALNPKTQESSLTRLWEVQNSRKGCVLCEVGT